MARKLKLVRPDRCMAFAGQNPNTLATTLCDTAMICQRCGFCLSPRACAASAGLKPWICAAVPVCFPQQMSLCDPPNLRYQGDDDTRR